jgi:pimeloyl-ACP methyl ester carboxylesterase
VIWGANDTVDSVTSGRATATALHTRFQAIPHAGHLSMLARPDAVARRILRLVATSAHARHNGRR